MKTIKEKKPNKEKPLFYGSSNPGITEIAQINKENGEVFQLITTGEIRIDTPQKTYRNNEINQLIKEKNLTDEKISNLQHTKQLTFKHNAWFEILYTNNKMDGFESIGNIAHTYSEGISKLKQQAEELPTQQQEVNA